MILKVLHTVPWLRKNYFHSWGPKWVNKKCVSFLSFLQPGDRILDIGSGSGLVVQHLRKKGYQVTGLDIEDLSFTPSVRPVVYDGKTMPFKEKEFDVALILTVLHHTENPEAILKEAKRVAHRIIIIEDIYSNKIQQYLTYWMDGFVNWKFSPCPRTNKTDPAWKKTFDLLELKLEQASYHPILLLFKQATYHLKNK